MKKESVFVVAIASIVCFIGGFISAYAGWSVINATLALLTLVICNVLAVAYAASRDNETW